MSYQLSASATAVAGGGSKVHWDNIFRACQMWFHNQFMVTQDQNTALRDALNLPSRIPETTPVFPPEPDTLKYQFFWLIVNEQPQYFQWNSIHQKRGMAGRSKSSLWKKDSAKLKKYRFYISWESSWRLVSYARTMLYLFCNRGKEVREKEVILNHRNPPFKEPCLYKTIF